MATLQPQLPMSTPAAHSADTEWKLPSWISDWHVGEKIPATIEQVNLEIAKVERFLDRVPHEAIGQLLDELLDQLNPPAQSAKHAEIAERLAAWWERTRPAYISDMADYPADLLVKACRAARSSCVTMPKVADLKRHVIDDLAERNSALVKLRVARQELLRIQAPKKFTPLTPAEQREVDAHLAKWGITPPSRETS